MAKQNLILLPGLLCNERVWQHQLVHLADIANSLVLPLRDNTPQKMVDFVLSHAPETFALAGHSMGGWLAMEVIAAAPERITQLCLLNTTAAADSNEKKAFRKQMIERCDQGLFTAVATELADKFIYHKKLMPEVTTMFHTEGAAVFKNQERAMLMRRDCLPLLTKVLCPTLVIHAEQDAVFTFADNKALADTIVGARFTIINDCGHMAPMEQPEAVTALLRQWLLS